MQLQSEEFLKLSEMLQNVNNSVQELRQETRDSISALDAKFDKLETKFDKLEAKVDTLETKFDKLEAKVDKMEAKIGYLDIKTDELDAKFDAKIDDLAAIMDQQFNMIMDKLADNQEKQTAHLILTKNMHDSLGDYIKAVG